MNLLNLIHIKSKLTLKTAAKILKIVEGDRKEL